jgi:hypothetical protein
MKKMEFFISETNREKKSLIYDGYTFSVDRVLKNSEIPGGLPGGI